MLVRPLNIKKISNITIMLSPKEKRNLQIKNKLENIICYMLKKGAFHKCKSEMLNYRRKAKVFSILAANWEKVQKRRQDRLFDKLHARFRSLGKPLPFPVVLWIYDP
jgi:hypothetical protein